MTMVKNDIFQAKKHQNFNFELQKSYIPQKKAENMYNMDSARKNENLCKKMIFFVNIFNFLEMLNDPQNLEFKFFKNFAKEISKMAFLGQVK